MKIIRNEAIVFTGATNISKMKRKPQELVEWLNKENDFPYGVLLMTGTGLVPEDEFTLQQKDVVKIKIGNLELENDVL